jgi:hypothetical protein
LEIRYSRLAGELLETGIVVIDSYWEIEVGARWVWLARKAGLNGSIICLVLPVSDREVWRNFVLFLRFSSLIALSKL